MSPIVFVFVLGLGFAIAIMVSMWVAKWRRVGPARPVDLTPTPASKIKVCGIETAEECRNVIDLLGEYCRVQDSTGTVVTYRKRVSTDPDQAARVRYHFQKLVVRARKISKKSRKPIFLGS